MKTTKLAFFVYAWIPSLKLYEVMFKFETPQSAQIFLENRISEALAMRRTPAYEPNLIVVPDDGKFVPGGCALWRYLLIEEGNPRIYSIEDAFTLHAWAKEENDGPNSNVGPFYEGTKGRETDHPDGRRECGSAMDPFFE